MYLLLLLRLGFLLSNRTNHSCKNFPQKKLSQSIVYCEYNVRWKWAGKSIAITVPVSIHCVKIKYKYIVSEPPVSVGWNLFLSAVIYFICHSFLLSYEHCIRWASVSVELHKIQLLWCCHLNRFNTIAVGYNRLQFFAIITWLLIWSTASDNDFHAIYCTVSLLCGLYILILCMRVSVDVGTDLLHNNHWLLIVLNWLDTHMELDDNYCDVLPTIC